MEHTYKITRWDAYTSSQNLIKLPRVYIEKSPELLKYNCEVIVEINGTNTVYDCKKIKGTILSDFSIVLDITWNGYPEPCFKGQLKIHKFVKEDCFCYKYEKDIDIYANYPSYCC